jgi:hypothetical protein
MNTQLLAYWQIAQQDWRENLNQYFKKKIILKSPTK